MSILSTLFSGKPTQQQQPQNQQQQQPGNGNPHIQGNNTIPNGNQPAANPNPQTEQTQSPTDKFKDLWSTPTQQQNQAPNFKLDPAQLSQTTSKMDFAKSVNREDLAKIAQGGEAAIEALGNVLNTLGREVFAQSAQFSSYMTDSGYQSASKVIDSGLPGAIKKQLTEQHLYQANPRLKDPALQPMIGALQTQFSQKYPNASPQEIESLVTQYMTEVVGAAFNKEEPASKQQAAAAPDFSSFL